MLMTDGCRVLKTDGAMFPMGCISEVFQSCERKRKLEIKYWK